MYGIQIVTLNQLGDDTSQVVAGCRYPRIEIEFSSILYHPFRMFECDMRRSQRFAGMLSQPVWIKPGMQLHVAAVTLLNPKLKRIEIGFRCLPGLPGKVARPWINAGGIKSIGGRPDLQNYRIHT